MPEAGNFYFIRSTKVKALEVISLNGSSLWTACNATFASIDAICGEGTSRLFAEPNVKSQEGGDVVNVAWFGSYDDDARDLHSIDRAKRARVEDDLIRRLAALRPALADPSIGNTVAAMLNLFDDHSIMAAGENAILTNWGTLPTEAMASEVGYAKHSEATVGRYLGMDVSPRLPGRAWSAHGSIEPKPQTQAARHVSPTAVSGSMPPHATPVVQPAKRTSAWWIPASFVALFACILFYAAWPGNLIYERESPAEQSVLSQIAGSNEALTREIAQLQTELGKDACEIDPTLVGLPPRDAASTTQTPAAEGQGSSQ